MSATTFSSPSSATNPFSTGKRIDKNASSSVPTTNHRVTLPSRTVPNTTSNGAVVREARSKRPEVKLAQSNEQLLNAYGIAKKPHDRRPVSETYTDAQFRAALDLIYKPSQALEKLAADYDVNGRFTQDQRNDLTRLTHLGALKAITKPVIKKQLLAKLEDLRISVSNPKPDKATKALLKQIATAKTFLETSQDSKSKFSEVKAGHKALTSLVRTGKIDFPRALLPKAPVKSKFKTRRDRISVKDGGSGASSVVKTSYVQRQGPLTGVKFVEGEPSEYGNPTNDAVELHSTRKVASRGTDKKTGQKIPDPVEKRTLTRPGTRQRIFQQRVGDDQIAEYLHETRPVIESLNAQSTELSHGWPVGDVAEEHIDDVRDLLINR